MIKLINKLKYDILFIILFLIFTLIFTNNFAIVRIKGNSMAPTYLDGQIAIIKKHKEAKVNDLIVFTATSWGAEDYKLIKRIVGTSEDEIYIDDRHLIINDESQEHLKYECQNLSNTERIFIYQDEFLVAGDNKGNSNDSIYQFCSDNESFKVNKEDIYMIGTELYVLGGLK